jgi:hypothetical protein
VPPRGRPGTPGERAQRVEGLVGVVVSDEIVDRRVEKLLHRADTAIEALTVCGEAQHDVPPVFRVHVPPDQALRDEAVDQPARAVAGLADQELAECGEGQRSVVTEHAQDLGLRRGHAQRP